MVKEWIRSKLGITENEKAIANNAAIDATQAEEIAKLTADNAAQAVDITKLTADNAAQAVDITKLTADNAAQAVDITTLTTDNAVQAEEIAKLAEAVGEQEKTLLICTIATAVAVIAITSFVAFCIYQGVKLEKEKEKNSLDQDTPDAKLNNVNNDDTKGLRKAANM